MMRFKRFLRENRLLILSGADLIFAVVSIAMVHWVTSQIGWLPFFIQRYANVVVICITIVLVLEVRRTWPRNSK